MRVRQIIIVRGNLRNDLRADFGMLHFDNTQLVPCECAKNLGVVLDSTLSFRPHIDSVVKTCNFHIRNLYMIRNFINRDNLSSLVYSLIVSKIDYCNSLLVGLPKVTLKKVQSILNRAARLIYSLPPQVPTTPFLMQLHWLPVKARVEFKICLITFRAQPLYIRELLSLAPVEPVMSLRSSDDPYHLCEPRAVGESNFANCFFSYVAPRLYNKLPLSLKQIESVDTFKKQLKSFFFSQACDLSDHTVREEYALEPVVCIF